MDNYEVLSGIAENCHPKFIANVDGVRTVVGEVIDGVVYLTEAGKKLIAQNAETVKASKGKGKKVESPATETDIDNL